MFHILRGRQRWIVAAMIAFALIVLAQHVETRRGIAATQTSGGYLTAASANQPTIARSNMETLRVVVMPSVAHTVLVDMEIYGPSGRVAQDVRTNQTISVNQIRNYSTSWTVPAGAALGDYRVAVGVFSPDWSVLYHWNNSAATFTVAASAPPGTATTPPGTSTPAPPSATPTRTTTAQPPAATPTRTPTPGSGSTLTPLPAGWPSNAIQLGEADAPGGAATLHGIAPFGMRYQYLSAGVNTGNGWANWNANGDFAKYYIQDSIANGMTPVFTYYMLAQSSPGNSQGESTGDYNNLQNTSTMTAYYNDLKLFFQRAGAFPNNRVILHVEPDMWGFVESRASNDDAGTIPAKVSSTGLSELSGLPENLPGFAQAIVRLRDRYAPNVLLGYHVSVWGTGNDIALTNPSDATVDSLATRAGNYFNSLHAPFDVAFAEFSDRDSAFKQYQYGDGGASWWDAGDFARNARFISKFVSVSRKRVIMWQIPLGNTKMRAMNNTFDHYQDNRVEWLLDDPMRAHLATYAQSGVIGFLFGRGADGATCSCDANNDGVTNPAAINGNNGTSLNADDDGGFFRQKAAAYYSAGAVALP